MRRVVEILLVGEQRALAAVSYAAISIITAGDALLNTIDCGCEESFTTLICSDMAGWPICLQIVVIGALSACSGSVLVS